MHRKELDNDAEIGFRCLDNNAVDMNNIQLILSLFLASYLPDSQIILHDRANNIYYINRSATLILKLKLMYIVLIHFENI
ncbi:MAG: hypothetical protein NWF08_04025 [Candidatus Bathyarchaeota archaeon]|nr:hypothetical protein [Candidatus Bathyarchaeota archaeon]